MVAYTVRTLPKTLLSVALIAVSAGSVPSAAWCADRVGSYGAPGVTNGASERATADDEADEEATEDEEDAVNVSDDIAPRRTDSNGPGQLWVTYEGVKNSQLKEVATLLSTSKGFDEIVAEVNEAFELPKIQVIFGECGQVNAFYHSESKRIIMCYELFEYFRQRFSEDSDLSEGDVISKVINGGIFTFYHELGHAFVDVFDLPITGKEEDAVDDLATLILVDAEKDEEEVTLVSDAMDTFWLNAEESMKDINFYDEHSLNQQRAYRMLCMMYGSDPEAFSDWVGEDWLPKERAPRCPGEYDRAKRAWTTLLAPYSID